MAIGLRNFHSKLGGRGNAGVLIGTGQLGSSICWAQPGHSMTSPQSGN